MLSHERFTGARQNFPYFTTALTRGTVFIKSNKIIKKLDLIKYKSQRSYNIATDSNFVNRNSSI